MTRYSNAAYHIKNIDFDLTPLSEFTLNGRLVTYVDYYKTKYNEEIKDLTQPLLLHKDRRTNRDVFLVPELCRMVGLTEQMRDDFKLMREYNSFVKVDAPIKVKECL